MHTVPYLRATSRGDQATQVSTPHSCASSRRIGLHLGIWARLGRDLRKVKTLFDLTAKFSILVLLDVKQERAHVFDIIINNPANTGSDQRTVVSVKACLVK